MSDLQYSASRQRSPPASARGSNPRQKRGDANSQKEPFSELPTVVTKRIVVPFEFRFTSQEVNLEIRDSSDNSMLYEVQIPFE